MTRAQQRGSVRREELGLRGRVDATTVRPATQGVGRWGLPRWVLGGAAAVLACVVLLAGQGFGLAVQAQTPTVDYDADGDGLIEVATVAQLNAIRWDLNGDGTVDTSANATGYATAFPNALTSPRMGCASRCSGYELSASLDLSNAGDATLGWAPIGDNSTDTNASRFTATFDGGAFTISNLFIGRAGSNTLGLFGRTGSTSLIRNVTLLDVSVSGFWQVAALVGWNSGSISGSSAAGTVTAHGNAGGLVGLNYGTISTSSAAVHVTGVQSLGGLVGNNYDAQADGDNRISESEASGPVTASGNLSGGLVGWNNGPISNSRASGDVRGVSYVGGLVGSNYDAQANGDNHISENEASGTVTATSSATVSGDFAGGLVGWTNGPVSNSRASGDVTGVHAVGGLVGSSYDQNNGGGNHISESAASGAVTASGNNAGGLVGWTNGPVSESAARGTVNASGENAGGLVGWTNGPVSESAARGTVNASGENAGGLVGRTSRAVSDSSARGRVTGRDFVGGLVGRSDGTFNANATSRSTASGAVTGNSVEGQYTGGLIGWNDGPVSDSFASGDVRGHDQVGGLVGYSNGVIADSSAIGAVGSSTSTGDKVGGLVGESRFGEVRGSTAFGNVQSTGMAVGGLAGTFGGRIIESAASGAVTGSVSTGGLAGAGTSSGTLSGSTASGTVNGTDEVGGLIGAASGLIDRSYATGEVMGTNNVGGLVGDLSGGIFASYATGTVTGAEAIGGLIGEGGTFSRIRASYATGVVTGSTSVGGLAGSLLGFGRTHYSYWDTETTGQSDGIGSDEREQGGYDPSGLTTSALQAPTGYAGVYLHWNVEHVSTDFGFQVLGAQDPWNFGGATDYPRLRRPSDPPSFGSTTASYSVGEDAAPGTDVGAPVTASDANGDTLVYALVGVDALAFDIDSGTGQLRVGAALDYETQSVYTFAVQASDGKLVAFRRVEIAVTDVDEPPVFGSAAATREVFEDVGVATAFGDPIVAVDPEDGSLSYSLAGPDAALFAISAAGQLRTNAILDYEFQSSHHVTVQASDDSNTASIDVTVDVFDSDDPGTLRVSSLQPQVGAALTATVADPDGNATGITWVWESSSDRSAWTAITGATSARYAPVAGNADKYLRVTASYRDPLGAGRSAQLEIDRAVRLAPTTTNATPAFPSTETGARSVAENTAGGQDIGAPVAATDSDSADTLTYSLSGAGADTFEIDPASGQLRTKSALDADRLASYAVTVTATDPSLASSSQAVTITITQVDEAPSLSGTAEIELAENRPGAVGSYSASDPESGTITWSLAGEDADDFAIASGSLSFVTTPDFEAPTDTGRDNVYHVSVQASDGTNTGARNVRVTITDVDEDPVVTGPDTATHAENTSGAVAAFSADDPENAPISWSLAGTDRFDFFITPTGVLKRNRLLLRNHEFPADSGGNNTYEVTVQASDGTTTSRHALAVTVTNAEEMPLVTGEAIVRFAENDSADVATYQATDPEGTTVTWLELAGADKDLFDLSDSGVLSFKQPPDFESPMDADMGNTYDLTVSAMDQAMLTGAWDLTVVVTDANEPPTLSGASALRFPEGDTSLIDSVAAYTAEDLDAGSAVFVWDLEGDDSNDFSIGSDGVLKFLAVPDFESPGDADRNSVYRVRVTARNDLTHTAELDVEVTITNEIELGSVLLSSQQAQANVPLVSELSDPDGGVANQTWTWWRFPDPQTGPWTRIDGATSATYTPTSADADHYLRVRVLYTDRAGGPDQQAAEAIAEPWSAGPPATNVPPEFPSSETGARDVDENTPSGVPIGNPIEATDPNDPFLTYLLDLEHLFDIDRATGQLSTKAALDHEHMREHRALVTVNDSFGASAMIIAVITVNDVNEPPLVSGEPLVAFTEHVPGPVATYTATDPEDSAIEWEVHGVDANVFMINAAGELSFRNPPFTPPEVDPGFECNFENWVPLPNYDDPEDLNADNSYEVIVRATDSDSNVSEDFDVLVRVTEAGPLVDCPLTSVPISTFAGGGGGGSGPPPSEVDFEWTVKHDIAALDPGHEEATGMWSDGATLWLLDNPGSAGDAAHAYDLESGERVEEREFELHRTNRAPRGVWSDRSTVWVSDSGQNLLFAYDRVSDQRDEEREIALADRNRDARGIWSDGETMWVLDGGKNSLFAYDLASGELLAEYALDAANDDPRGIWSDGISVWVSDHVAKRLLAYRLPTRQEAEAAGEDASLERVRGEEFTELSGASNNSPRGIWSDGDVMYVADESDGKVYTYNMPNAIDARLASLRLTGIDIGDFGPDQPEYRGGVAEDLTETTVVAEAMQRLAEVVIDPPDANANAEGHQVALEDLSEIAVTVTSADGSREQVYRVRLGEPDQAAASELTFECFRGAVAAGFSLVVYGGGSIDDFEACAESRHITALYALDDGAYVSYILGAPEFVNASFRELFPDGLPPLTALTVKSEGPPTADPFLDGDAGDDVLALSWSQCLRGEIVEGFSLVLYEGGSVADLESCAQSLGLTALYALSEGEFVSYILGAPDFVNQRFRELYADGLSPIAPLVARSAGPPVASAGSDADAGN